MGVEIMNIGGIDCYEVDGVAYLELEAVARGLGFTDTHNGTDYVRWARVDRYLEELGFATSGERPDFIPENIFYRLAMKAKNQVAEAFQAKVADEVIPSIRKHGAYMTPDTIEKVLQNPDTIIKLATALKEEQQRRKALESQITADKPLTDFARTVSDCLDAVTVGEYAKLLFDRDGIDIGRNRLYRWLRYNGYLMEHNEPHQSYIADGTFVSILTNRGGNLYPITLVTGKGMVKLFPQIADWWDKNHPETKRHKPLGLDEINRYILEAKSKGYTERRMAEEIGTITNIAVHKRIVKLRKAGLLNC